jgi:hypothetical protein
MVSWRSSSCSASYRARSSLSMPIAYLHLLFKKTSKRDIEENRIVCATGAHDLNNHAAPDAQPHVRLALMIRGRHYT